MAQEYYLGDKGNRILYHYCSAGAFEKIIRSQTLWLRQVSVMNDRMEHRWLKSLAFDMFPKRVVLDAIEGRATNSAELLDVIETQLREVRHDDPFCICFSEDGDLLSQWRAYAVNGEGYAIGFQFHSLNFTDDTFPWKVLYGTDLQKQLVRELLDAAVSGQLLSDENATLKDIAEEFHRRLLVNSICCKNPAFQEEKEWRVIYGVDSMGLVPEGTREEDWDFESNLASEFVVRGSELRHHLVLPFNPNFGRYSVVSIRLGPRNPNVANRFAVRRFLDAMKYSHVRILRSKATYR